MRERTLAREPARASASRARMAATHRGTGPSLQCFTSGPLSLALLGGPCGEAVNLFVGHQAVEGVVLGRQLVVGKESMDCAVAHATDWNRFLQLCPLSTLLDQSGVCFAGIQVVPGEANMVPLAHNTACVTQKAAFFLQHVRFFYCVLQVFNSWLVLLLLLLQQHQSIFSQIIF